MSKHTQGPWRAGRPDMATIVDRNDYADSKFIYAGERSSNIGIAVGHEVGSWEEVMANAHLIAAAPELLEAAKYAMQMLGEIRKSDAARFGDEHAAIFIDPMTEKFQSAIAKAEGAE